jgi:phospholipase C
LGLELVNRGRKRETLHVYDAYTKRSVKQSLEPGGIMTWHWSLEDSYGWYDLTITADNDARFRQQLAGHVETGKNSASDPALGV